MSGPGIQRTADLRVDGPGLLEVSSCCESWAFRAEDMVKALRDLAMWFTLTCTAHRSPRKQGGEVCTPLELVELLGP